MYRLRFKLQTKEKEVPKGEEEAPLKEKNKVPNREE